ncbi:MAG: SDR family oxidoreductase [Candidatus Sulfotelmatobacter sp.]
MRKTVVISGGSRGLGETIAKSFLAEGQYNVAVCSRSSSRFVESIAQDPTMTEHFLFQPVDLGDRQSVHSFVGAIKERFGTLHILVNNAGIALDGVLALQGEQAIDQMIDVNLKGTIAITKSCIREMLINRWGRIVTITSIVGRSGFRGLSVYSLTKAGLDGFTRSLARELGDRGITVNSVAPGFLETEMTHGLSPQQRDQIVRRTPARRLGRGEDVTGIVKFLCSDAAEFVTGQTIVVDGGAMA